MNNGDMSVTPCEITFTEKNDGYFTGHIKKKSSGMTKREMIAMHLMAANIQVNDPNLHGIGNDTVLPMLAAQSVVAADALLKELEK